MNDEGLADAAAANPLSFTQTLPRIWRRSADAASTGVVRSRRAVQNFSAPISQRPRHVGKRSLVGRYGGRIIDTAGDGILAEFPSVINATECAVEIQTVMATRNEGVLESRRMRFRIGINLGDIIHDETRIYGDGINVAARLEGIAEPGGICISRQVFDQVNRALKADFQALGPRTFKNIARPVDVFALATVDRGAGVTPPNAVDLKQEIRFCTAPDGVQLAYSMIGQGPPLMKTGNWMTHLEFALESPIWRHLYQELAKEYTLVRYDARGSGLSDRTVDEITFDAYVRDLETVVEAAALTRFALFGISQGCAVSSRTRCVTPSGSLISSSTAGTRWAGTGAPGARPRKNST
jgi:alpha/beta hydrolase fold/Adenylate and Guanylate cyclase catalytic domain